MPQVKIYGLKSSLENNRKFITTAIHESLQETFKLPAEKLFLRFMSLSKEDFVFPSDRSENYTIIELSIFEGRSTEARKQLIKSIFNNMKKFGIDNIDVEITIFETPMVNWGIRGKTGDELQLNYKVDV